MKQPIPLNEHAPLLNKPVKPAELSGVENLIRQMLKKHKTPFMIIRKSVLEKQLSRFQKAFPQVTPYYAIKANPHPRIVKFSRSSGLV